MEEREERAKKGIFTKVLALILSGMLVGSVAGIAFYGTTSLIKYFDPVLQVMKVVGFVNEDIVEEIFENENELENTTVLQTTTEKVTTLTDVSDIAKAAMPSLVSIINEYTATQNIGYF